MSFTKWFVTRWGNKPESEEFERETGRYYTGDRQRVAKVSSWYDCFDTEQQALDFIAERERKKVDQKALNQIRSVAPELLEALELILRKYEAQADYAELDTDGEATATARAVIAKARGKEEL